MKHIFLAVLLISAVSISSPVYAESAKEGNSSLFVITDILIYRPLGLAATIAGAGLFVAMSPVTAFAQITPPHNAFEKTSDILIKGPVRFTFSRPLGKFD